MKRVILSIIGLVFICGASVFAITPTDAPQGKTPVPKASYVKKPVAKAETRMRAIGIVKDLTDSMIRIERNVTAEVMEFNLENPLPKISLGDKVVVSYIEKDGKNIAKKVNKAVAKKKSVTPQAGGPVPVKNPPVSAR